MAHEIASISELPNIDELKKRSKALALADAIFMRDWSYRYFSFNSLWDKHGTEAMASMRDGSGSEYFLHFGDAGVAGKVLADTPLLELQQSLNKVPNAFAEFKTEPAFKVAEASFYFWRLSVNGVWSASPNNLSTYPLLGFLVGGHGYYREWAQDYYEREIDASLLEEVFSSLSVTDEQLRILNPELRLDEMHSDLLLILSH
jgi:hypothetical protein